MQLLSFDVADITYNDLGRRMALFSGPIRHVPRIHLSPDKPTHYFTVNDGNKLKEFMRLLKREGINFKIITEKELPASAMSTLTMLLNAGMEFVNHS